VRWGWVFGANASLMAFMGLLLALPLPPVIPFSNAFPGYAIVFLAAGMMEEDGVSIGLGYLAAVGTVLYFVFIAGGLVTLVTRYYDRIAAWLQSLL